MDYINQAKEIISKQNLQKYVDLLLDYWETNPPTMGHGFSHVLKVAVTAYEVSQENGMDNPADYFLAGLFHDVYRPAEGADGAEEHHEESAELIGDLFKSLDTPEQIIRNVQEMIDVDLEAEIKKSQIVFSISDKITHDTTLTNSYVWASNDFLKKSGKPPRYNSHQITLYAFFIYQKKAWEIFMKHPIKGTDRAMESYLNIIQETKDELLKDKKAEHFDEYIEKKAEEYRKIEKEFLTAFGRSETSIENIMSKCY